MIDRRSASLFLCLVGCDDATSPRGRSDDQLAADLAARIVDDVAWSAPAGWEGRAWRSDGSPHGPWVEIRANDVAADALGGRMPAGAILTKRMADTEDGELGPVTFAMWQLRGYAPDRGDWFFAMWTDGELEVSGSPDGCWNCHSSGADAVRSVLSGPGTPPPR